MTDNTMTCDRFTDRLMAYLEQETDGVTRAAIERHAATCDNCGPLLADLRELRGDAANLSELAPSRDLWDGIAARIEAPVMPIGGAGVAHRMKAPARSWRRVGRVGRVGLIAASLLAAAGLGYVARGGPAPQPFVPEVASAPRLPADTSRVVSAMEPAAPNNVEVSAPVQRAPVVAASQPRASDSASATLAATPPRAFEVQLAVATLNADYDREIARLRTLIERRRNELDPVTVAIIEKNLTVIDTAIAESKKAVASDPSSRFLIEYLNQSLQSKVELMRTVAMLPNRT